MKYVYISLLLVALLGCNKPPEVESEQPITVVPYPNPGRDMVRIFVQNSSRSEFLLQVFNPKGKVVFEQQEPGGGATTSNFTVSVVDFGTGAFHASLQKDGSVFTKKFMIL